VSEVVEAVLSESGMRSSLLNVAVVLPAGARGLLLVLLLLVVQTQGSYAAAGQGDAAFGGLGLGG
jgi:hypothetical protein